MATIGADIDDSADSPVGTREYRKTIAIHWHWTTEYTTTEIADALGVRADTVREYVSEGPSDAVQKQIENVESEVRLVAVQELRSQLQAAGHRSRTAETPAEIWQDGDGDIQIREQTDDEGTVQKRIPVANDIELLPDQEARYYARAEVREIIDQLVDLVGAGEPQQVELNANVEHEVKSSVVEITEDDLTTE